MGKSGGGKERGKIACLCFDFKNWNSLLKMFERRKAILGPLSWMDCHQGHVPVWAPPCIRPVPAFPSVQGCVSSDSHVAVVVTLTRSRAPLKEVGQALRVSLCCIYQRLWWEEWPWVTSPVHLASSCTDRRSHCLRVARSFRWGGPLSLLVLLKVPVGVLLGAKHTQKSCVIVSMQPFQDCSSEVYPLLSAVILTMLQAP